MESRSRSRQVESSPELGDKNQSRLSRAEHLLQAYDMAGAPHLSDGARPRRCKIGTLRDAVGNLTYHVSPNTAWRAEVPKQRISHPAVNLHPAARAALCKRMPGLRLRRAAHVPPNDSMRLPPIV